MRLREDEAPHAGMGDVLLELADRMANARERYEGLVEWRSAETTSVEFASDVRLSYQPLDFERHGWRPGRLLKNRPARGDYVEDFFDSAARWIATCEHTVAGGYAYYEEFFERKGSGVEGTRFDTYEPDRKPLNTSRASFDGDLIIDYSGHGQEGWSYEVYRRDVHGIITTIECVQFQPLYHEQLAASVVSIEYDSDGAVQAIRQAWESGEDELLYQRQ
jgi:hypothetical protein